ncbi:MAG: extracellular solute-binding protein [Clostridia bacterium]|nr:extracellular solute-binding protein [Clostridia bacterium]
MKRFVAMLLVCIMLLSLLSFASADEKKTLTVWIPQYQFSKAEDAISDQDFWDGVFEEFEKENNCEVNVTILSWSDYNTTVYTGLLNNDGPDVVYVTDNYDLVQANLLLGLEDYLTEEEIANYTLWNVGPVNSEGKHVIVPMDDGVSVGYYNKDILAEAGLSEDPATWESYADFIAACKTVQEKTGKQAFLQNWGATTGTSALMLCFWPYYFQNGGVMLDENGQIAINNEAGLKTLEFLKSLYDEGIFDETIVSESESIDKFGNGELAFVFADMNKGSNFTANGVNWGYFFSLKGSEGYGARTATDSFALGVKAKERGNAELAAKALVLITSGKVMDEFHEKIFYLPPFTKDATYVKDEELFALTSSHIDSIYVVSEFEGKASFEKELQANIQMMYMGDLTPQEVLDNTMSYYAEQIKQ